LEVENMSGEMEKIRKKLDELEKNRERGREKHREAGSTDQGTRREIEEEALIAHAMRHSPLIPLGW
jgi:hypothetical protein